MRMIGGLRWVSMGAAMLLAGCPDPGVTENPLDTPEGGRPVVSVCYPPLVTDRAELEPVAAAACETSGVGDASLRYWKKNLILNECPLLKKARMSFYCDEGAGAAGPDRAPHELYLPQPADPAAEAGEPAP